MSEQPVAQPEEPKATEGAPVAPEATATPEVVTPETAILSKDPEVVQADLAKAEPVVTDPVEPVTTDEAPAATEETPAETPAPAVEKKEGSGLVAFIKKRIPNPKSVDKKAAKPETPAKTETEAAPEPKVVEPAAEEGPFEGDTVSFKSHGGIFGGGWKERRLEFGKETGLTTAALSPYIAAHKIASVISPTDKINAAWDNAAHATVTGVGLLYVTKFKNIEVPISVINLADITSVTVNGTHFTIKTEHAGDYEFGTNTADKVQKWKTEIDTRTEQAKLIRSGVVESDKYKESLAHFKDLKGPHKAHEAAVTSDEEAGVSGDESRRPKGWTRRISGSFGKLTGSSKEAAKEPAPEAPKDAAVVAPTESTADAAAETPVVETPAADEVTEPTATETPAEAPASDEPETARKEKRKSFTGFAGLFKSKGSAKESSPEPVAKEPASEETPAVEPVTETPAVVSETPATTEETAPTPEIKEKAKRGSIFLNILPKKDKPAAVPVTNGETPAVPEATEEPAAQEDTPATTEEAEFKPPVTERKESLARRLTSQFKSLGRSKSPEKAGKATKVSDEAPKIDTPIESTPAEAATTSDPTADATPAVPEPLTTTEAPPVDVPATTVTEPTPAVVTTQA